MTTSADIDTSVPPPPRVQGSADDQVRALRFYSDNLAQRLQVQIETIKAILAENGM